MSMTDDDDRAIARLLADPSLWLDPDPSLEATVSTAIAGEIAAGGAAVVVPLHGRRRWTSHAVAAMIGAAAAAVFAIVVTRPGGGPSDQASAEPTTVELLGTDLAPGFVGAADVTVESSGVLIRLTMPGLPRRDGDEFYEGWLKSCDGARLVPIGTFHDMDRAAGWAGVSIADYPLLTVTAEEVAGPTDAEQGSSGRVIAAGSISPCPGAD